MRMMSVVVLMAISSLYFVEHLCRYRVFPFDRSSFIGMMTGIIRMLCANGRPNTGNRKKYQIVINNNGLFDMGQR